MMQRIREVLLLLFLAVFSKAVCFCTKPYPRPSEPEDVMGPSYCLSWRLGVEANNIRAWRTVPTQCLGHVKTYMIGGQYEHDLNFIIQHIISYVNSIMLSDDGRDAWILDVDDTCISNILYYKSKRFGCDPYDPNGFKIWASKGWCPVIPAVLTLFNTLVDNGFKVFLVTGRDEETLSQPTLDNLHNEGFTDYERLILRKQLVGEGYRIWGNVGDQWSDLEGEYVGNRTFKLPNPMYFVP